MVVIKSNYYVWVVLNDEFNYKYGYIYRDSQLRFMSSNIRKYNAYGDSLIELLLNAGFSGEEINSMRVYREE